MCVGISSLTCPCVLTWSFIRFLLLTVQRGLEWGKRLVFPAKTSQIIYFSPPPLLHQGTLRASHGNPLLPILPCYNFGLDSSCVNQITHFPRVNLTLASHHIQEETKLLPLSHKALHELSLPSSLAAPPRVTVFQPSFSSKAPRSSLTLDTHVGYFICLESSPLPLFN